MGTNAKNHPPLDATAFWEIVSAGIVAGQSNEPLPDNAPAAGASPWYRAGVAIRELMGEDNPQFNTAMARFTALMDLYGSGAVDDWLRSSDANPDNHDIHPALIDVAARMRLSSNGRFAKRKFLENVEAHAHEWYGEFDEWNQSSAPGERAQAPAQSEEQ